MRHRKKVRKLGLTASHRKAMLSNMVTSLFEHEQIRTTTPKAKALKIWTDRLVSLAKRGDLHSRRLAAATIRDKVILKKLFDEIAPQLKDNTGGSCRIIHLGHRLGDGASVSLVRLLTYSGEKEREKEKKKVKAKRPKREKAPEAEASRGKKRIPGAEKKAEREKDEEKE